MAAVSSDWQGAVEKRKAWAKSRDSWQASEAERLSPDTQEQEQKLPPATEGGMCPTISMTCPTLIHLVASPPASF